MSERFPQDQSGGVSTLWVDRAGAMSDDCRGQNTQNLLTGLLRLIPHM
jgi:hypothetical protein